MPRVVVFDEFGGPDVMHVVEEPVVEPIEVLTNWARDYGGAIADFQEAAEATTPARARAES